MNEIVDQIGRQKERTGKIMALKTTGEKHTDYIGREAKLEMRLSTMSIKYRSYEAFRWSLDHLHTITIQSNVLKQSNWHLHQPKLTNTQRYTKCATSADINQPTMTAGKQSTWHVSSWKRAVRSAWTHKKQIRTVAHVPDKLSKCIQKQINVSVHAYTSSSLTRLTERKGYGRLLHSHEEKGRAKKRQSTVLYSQINWMANRCTTTNAEA